jgi:RNA polymerase sigma factor (sigma-70 family)
MLLLVRRAVILPDIRLLVFVTFQRIDDLTEKLTMNTLLAQASASHQIDDAAVIRRVLGGEKELFEILLRRYNQKLYRVIRSYLRDQDDIEDAMQETYLKAFGKLEQFMGNASFSTWLIRIGINEALLRLKRNKTRRLYGDTTDLMQDNIVQLPDNDQTNPEKMTIGKETKQLIESAIDELPEKYRVIYVMKEVEGMDNAAISQCLGISDGNVKVRIHRTRSLMKDALLRLSSDARIFEFGNSRCDAVVDFVMRRI